MITPHVLQSESPSDELAMLLVGDKKAGKSWLAATAPGNILFLEMDRRLAAMRSHPNVKNIYGLEFSDDPDATKVPTGLNDMLDILNKLEKSPLLRDLHSTFANCGDKLVDTIVFDSIQTISDSARRFVLFSSGGDDNLAKVFRMGQRVYRVAKSYHAWGGEMEMVTSAIMQARALLHCKQCHKSVTYRKDASGMGVCYHTDAPQTVGSKPILVADGSPVYDHQPQPRAMNIICNLHEAMEQDERSTPENPIYTGKIEVFPRRYHTLLVYFNEVWRLTRESGRLPKIACDPDGKFTQAATALGIQKVDTPDISAVLRQVRNTK